MIFIPCESAMVVTCKVKNSSAIYLPYFAKNSSWSRIMEALLAITNESFDRILMQFKRLIALAIQVADVMQSIDIISTWSS